MRKMLISFLFLDENICCGYSLEAPRRGTSNEYPQRGASNEYPQHMFRPEIRKILCGYPLLSVAMSQNSRVAICLGSITASNLNLTTLCLWANSADNTDILLIFLENRKNK